MQNQGLSDEQFKDLLDPGSLVLNRAAWSQQAEITLGDAFCRHSEVPYLRDDLFFRDVENIQANLRHARWSSRSEAEVALQKLVEALQENINPDLLNAGVCMTSTTLTSPETLTDDSNRTLTIQESDDSNESSVYSQALGIKGPFMGIYFDVIPDGEEFTGKIYYIVQKGVRYSRLGIVVETYSAEVGQGTLLQFIDDLPRAKLEEALFILLGSENATVVNHASQINDILSNPKTSFSTRTLNRIASHANAILCEKSMPRYENEYKDAILSLLEVSLSAGILNKDIAVLTHSYYYHVESMGPGHSHMVNTDGKQEDPTVIVGKLRGFTYLPKYRRGKKGESIIMDDEGLYIALGDGDDSNIYYVALSRIEEIGSIEE